jgi:hypothetical protein
MRLRDVRATTAGLLFIAATATSLIAPQGRTTRPGWPLVPARTGRSSLGRWWSRAEKRRTRGIRAAAGGSLPALNPAKSASTHQGVSKDAPNERQAADRTIGLVPGNSSRGSCSLPPACAC